MIKIACDKKGTHALQAIISLISRDQEEQLLELTLKDSVLDLSFVLNDILIIIITIGSSRNSFDTKIYCISVNKSY